MKNSTFLLKPILFIFGMLLYSANSNAQTTIASYDFSTGLQGWTDGGNDAGLLNHAAWSCTNDTFSIYSKDNDTANNYMTSPALNFVGYTSIAIDFCHKANIRVDNGEGFTIEYFNGTNWTAVQTFVRGVDFIAVGAGVTNNFSVTLNAVNYVFNNNSRFRFTSTASANNERSTFDDVIVTGYNAVLGPEINITGLGVGINDGDTTPSVIDDTEFGLVLTGTTIDRTFTIENTGSSILNLNGTPMVNLIGNAAFSVLTQPGLTSIPSGGSLTFTVRFSPTLVGTNLQAVISINNDDSDENPYNFTIQGTATTPTYCPSNGINTDGYNTGTRHVIFNTINNATPNEDNDYSDFTAISTTVAQASAYNLTVNANTDGNYTTFTNVWIDWNQDTDFDDAGEFYALGTAINTLNGPTSLSPLSITIPNTATLGNTRMRVSTKYGAAPSNCETGFDGEVEDYTINVITGTVAPEINITGLGTTINNGDIIPSTIDGTDYGIIAIGNASTRTYTIENTGTAILNIGAISFTGANAAEFLVTAPPATTIAVSGSTTFSVTFTPTANGTRVANLEIINNDLNENPYNFVILGNGVAPLTEGPGGVTIGLELWLKATNGLSYTDGQSVSLWADQGRGSNATVNTAGQEPTYRDNITKNINFNPVVEFDNTFSTFTIDADFSYDDNTTQFLEGTSGLYTQDIFIVIIADETPINNSFGFMDVFCGDTDMSTDVTDTSGIGFGDFTSRITGESISFALDTFDPADPGDGYAVHDGTAATYTNVGIINTRNNLATTQQELYYNANNIETTQNDIAEFTNVNDSRFWLGRSEGWEASLNARVAEVITFSSRLSDIDLTDKRNRVQSYLGIKYGITLGINGTSQDYVDSNGSVIWDQSANTGFNYDISGIGRDDASNLNQKQSSSINNAVDANGPIEGILTMGLTNIYNTNNINKATNTNTLNDKDFLVWGNNNASLEATPNTISVDMSAGITGLSTLVSFLGMQRIWKVVENGSDIGEVKISIPQNTIRNITPPGNYYMFISDTPVFDPTADYRVMTINGSNLETTYNFNATKFITFGYAPQVIVERSIYFDGIVDYIDVEDNLDLNTTEFTLSAWIKRDTGTTNASILSKRNATNTEGYDLSINSVGRLVFSLNGGLSTLTSSVKIPENEWHQVAVIFNNGTATLYIDGVADTTAFSLTNPIATSQKFLIAAADGFDPNTTAYFAGNIDEVRIWDTTLSLEQLRYIMNQEILENTALVNGKIVPNTITKNEIASISWSDLAGYFPMSIYTYTNTNDASGNGYQGALRNLNTVDFQTAPLPYRSENDSDWDLNTTWTNGNVQSVPGTVSIVDSAITVDWNIVETSHNVSLNNTSLPVANNNNRVVLSLNTIANTLTVTGDTNTNSGNGLTVSHYLKIDGKIDLNGESQLIQTLNSDLDSASAGTIERDQQGTQDVYTYNYWSSPVGVSNTTTNNNSYTVPEIYNDGSNPVLPLAINFITNSYNGTPSGTGTPIGIADYWIWKYANLSSNYYNWQHVRSTGSLLTGEGFTMKGVVDTTNNLVLEQNYVIEGKPNNGTIALTIDPASEYLVGNPYASAIDANKFILDNTNTTGAIYFWEHFGGGTHNTIGYQGGYATYNLSGGVPAIKYNYVTASNDPTGGNGTKTPGRYIPVAQGFFVTGTASGTINFNNSQRVFQKENSNSVFLKTSNNTATYNPNQEVDNRLKIRLSFSTPDAFNRQLLVTRDANATALIDFGYDAENTEALGTDVYWIIDNKKFAIQGTNSIQASTILPLGIKTAVSGLNTFKIDALENATADLEIFIYDNATGLYHDIRNNPNVTIDIPAGEYLNRFELRFSNANTLTTQDIETTITDIQFYFTNDNETIVINNPMRKNITQVEIFNMLGQSIIIYKDIENENYITLNTNNIITGNYILEIKTEEGKLSKKVLIK